MGDYTVDKGVALSLDLPANRSSLLFPVV